MDIVLSHFPSFLLLRKYHHALALVLGSAPLSPLLLLSLSRTRAPPFLCSSPFLSLFLSHLLWAPE